jgi:predicted NUDIX family NTP pyrophosphohydrolase
MAKQSAGLLIYRECRGRLEVLLAHPGGPFWKKKDEGAWTIPKGELLQDEDPLQGAQRECQEELGFVPTGTFIPLSPVKQKAGKVIQAWGVRADWDPSQLKSNSFTLEWPPRSGKVQEFPEVDRAAYFELPEAEVKVNAGQVALLRELKEKLGSE